MQEYLLEIRTKLTQLWHLWASLEPGQSGTNLSKLCFPTFNFGDGEQLTYETQSVQKSIKEKVLGAGG